MPSWQISESGTAVALDDQGRGEVTFTVTNAGTEQDRSVLTVSPLDGAAETWFTVEEPQRVVAAGQSAAYLCKVGVPADTAAGTYALQAIAYSADHDPGESSATSRRVTMEVAEPPEPSKPKWWLYLVIALVVAAVIGAALWFLFKDDGFGNTEKPVVTGTPEVLQELSTSEGEWSEEDPRLAVQWQRCDAEGEDCEDIANATLSSYTAGNDDIDRALRVEITATTAGDESATATSDPTAPVKAPDLVSVPVPPVVNLTLSEANGVLSASFQVVVVTAGDPINTCNPPVEDQSPVAGTMLKQGEQVTISTRPPFGKCFRFGDIEYHTGGVVIGVPTGGSSSEDDFDEPPAPPGGSQP